MVGYATDETTQYLPISYFLCNEIMRIYYEKLESQEINFGLYDTKTQVTFEYMKINNRDLIPK